MAFSPSLQDKVLDEVEVLPDSRPVAMRGTKRKRVVTPWGAVNYIPVYCANCGKDGGMVPEENCTFVFYLCTPCHEKLGPIVGTYAVPDEVWWERVRQAQLESYGRELTQSEIITELADVNSALSKLVRDSKNPYQGA